MPPSKTEIATPTPRVAAPAYALDDHLLDSVLATLPAMAAEAPPAWQRTYRASVAREIASFHPKDVLQARLAGQIVTLRHLAAWTGGRADPRTCTALEMRRLGRMADDLVRTGRGAEKLLRSLQGAR
jgi:hypothetical protein